MTASGVPDDDMPNFPWSGRREAASLSDAALAALLAGADLPAEAPTELRAVAETLAALTGGPAGDELAGQAVALAEFRDRLGVPGPVPLRRRRPPLLAPVLSAKAAAVAAIVLSLGGLATAAYAGALPAPAQQFAHSVIGAPAAHPNAADHPAGNSSPVGPDATGPAAYGLCTAWSHAKAQGTHKQQAVAFRNLAAAAGGAANVAAFCAAVPHPGSTVPPTAQPAPSHRGRPTAHPTPSHPTGKPSPQPTPSHPTGQP